MARSIVIKRQSIKYIEKVEMINIEYHFGTSCSLQCRRIFGRASEHILISSFQGATTSGGLGRGKILLREWA